jgi:hypothetical protein
MPIHSSSFRPAGPRPAKILSPPARRRWLARKLASLGLMPPAEVYPLRPRRTDYVQGGRAVTFLVRPTTPLFATSTYPKRWREA